jgi:predicted nucleic acid-binding protein
MPNELVFVDTNILVYAHDAAAGRKHARAQQLLRELIQQPMLPVISAQVLQELYVTLIRRQVSPRPVREIVSAYMSWQVIANDASLVTDAMAITERWQISLWDSLIIAAALRSGASTVWSEDLNDGQNYGGVTVVNPLR